MIGHDDRQTLGFEPVRLSPQPSYRRVGLEQLLGRNTAYGKDQLRPDQRDLPIEVWPACGSLIRRRVPVVRRPAFQDIGNENVLPGKPQGQQHLVQKLACPPDERLAAAIFLGARRFANDHQFRFAIAHPEDGLRAAFMQGTTRAMPDSVAECVPIQFGLVGNIGDFVVMASTLMEIKSRELIPRESVNLAEELDPRDELIRQLLEYQRYRDITLRLEERGKRRERSVARRSKGARTGRRRR